MRKSRLFILALCISVLMFALNCLAGDSQYHNSKLRRLLFTSGIYQADNKNDSDSKIELLESAVFLCIDQFGKNTGSEQLALLKTGKVKNIVKSIDELNDSNVFYHRNYTHRGWDFVYPDDRLVWNERKKILVNTVETVFQFDKSYSSEKGAEKYRNAFCEILYYHHILSDWYYDDLDNVDNWSGSNNKDEIKLKDRGLMIAFANAHPSESNPDIFFEMDNACRILFSDQENTYKYSSLMQQMKTVAEKARSLQGKTGGVRTLEDLETRVCYEKDLLDLIEAYIPLMLDDEDFFRNAFPD